MPDALKNLLLVVVSTCIALLMADGLLRLYERSARAGHSAISDHAVDLAQLNFNDSGVERAKGANEYRVLSLGDSFAYTITKYPWSYHGVAAAMVDTQLPGTWLRIVNLGQPSISFYQYMEAYRYWSSLIEHDAVVFNVYLGNDILDVAYHHVPDRVEVPGAFARFHYSLQTAQIIPDRLPRKFPLRIFDYLFAYYHIWTGGVRAGEDAGIGPYNYSMLNLGEDRYYEVLHKQMDNFDPAKLAALEEGYAAVAEFAAFVSETRRSGKPVVVMLSPSEVQVTPFKQQAVDRRFDLDPTAYDFELPAYLVGKIFQSVDDRIPLIHLFEAFRCATDAGVDLYYQTDTHWTAEGNRLAGEVLADFVGEQWFGLRVPGGAYPDCAKTGREPEETEVRRSSWRALGRTIGPGAGPSELRE